MQALLIALLGSKRHASFLKTSQQPFKAVTVSWPVVSLSLLVHSFENAVLSA